VQWGVDWGKDLLFLDAEGKGARINIPLDVAESGRYEIVARTAEAPDYGDYIALVDGEATNLDKRKPATSEIPFPGPEVFHSYLPEVYVAADRPLGWFQFEKGRHTVSFVCVGRDERSAGYNFGVEDLILEKLPTSAGQFEPKVEHHLAPDLPEPTLAQAPGTPVYRRRPLADYVENLRQAPAAQRADVLRAMGSFGRDGAPAASAVAGALADPDAQVRGAAAWALSQIGAPGAAAVPALGRALSDSSPRVRSLAAVALEAMGPSASPALPELVRALNDPVEYVRVPAADALGAMGPVAGGAARSLAERLLVKGEQVMVLRSVAAALGNIGPGAREALPALEETRKTLRVSYTIEAAILKIQGKPVPSWW
jgi:HEAT repeat protein